MPRARLLLPIVISMIALAIGDNTPSESPPDLRGTVTKISDGDTITIRDASHVEHKIRLHAIDAPEKSQPFGTKAREALSDLIGDNEVRVTTHGTDRYGRTLGTVFVSGTNGVGETNINQQLVKDGWAWHYKRFSQDKVLAELELEARNGRRGLWTDQNGNPNPIPPWDWRKGKR